MNISRWAIRPAAWLAGVGLLGLLWSGVVEAQTRTAPSSGTKAPSAADHGPEAIKSKPTRDRTPPAAVGNAVARRNSPLEPNPNAKYVCTETTVAHPPVWRGGEDPKFGFKIHNAGTADLHIRAKGG